MKKFNNSKMAVETFNEFSANDKPSMDRLLAEVNKVGSNTFIRAYNCTTYGKALLHCFLIERRYSETGGER